MKKKPTRSSGRTLGSSPAGQAAAARIVAAAREVLTQKGCTDFSMRTVAAHAGMHLANVQYYFRTRDDLARALMVDTGRRYQARFARIRSRAPADRVAQFEAALEAALRDSLRPSVRRFFVQLWAMLLSLDGGRGAFVNELYAIAIDQYASLISRYNPALSDTECRRRATVLSSMIEGLVLAHGANRGGAAELDQMIQLGKWVGLQIAGGQSPAVPPSSTADPREPGRH